MRWAYFLATLLLSAACAAPPPGAAPKRTAPLSQEERFCQARFNEMTSAYAVCIGNQRAGAAYIARYQAMVQQGQKGVVDFPASSKLAAAIDTCEFDNKAPDGVLDSVKASQCLEVALKDIKLPKPVATEPSPARRRGDTAMSNPDFRVICEREWRGDFRMQEYCINQQRNGHRKTFDLNQEVEAIGNQELKMAVGKCLLDWRDRSGQYDWRMVAYCIERQLDSFRRLRR